MPCAPRDQSGNDPRQVFRKDGDFYAFLKAMKHACIEIPMPVLGYCLFPNRFHMVLLPKEDSDVSR
jgi:putative transposase